MRVHDTTWMGIEAYLGRDDRAVVPLGSTEQHAYLSLLTDTILAEKVSRDAADPLGIPVFPALPYGISPYFAAYPGTVGLSVETYARVVEEILDSLTASGFRRIALVSGHGGNAPAAAVAREWSARHEGVRVKYHGWWEAPRTAAKVREIDPVQGHASWSEAFPWTRVDGVEPPEGAKEPVDYGLLRVLHAAAVRDLLKDGNFGGRYARPDEEMLAIWEVAVEETRTVLEEGWG